MKKNKKRIIENNISLIIMKGFRALLQKIGRGYTCSIIRDGRSEDGIVEMSVKHPRYAGPCFIMIYDGCMILLSRRIELADPNVEEKVIGLINGFFGKSSK